MKRLTLLICIFYIFYACSESSVKDVQDIIDISVDVVSDISDSNSDESKDIILDVIISDMGDAVFNDGTADIYEEDDVSDISIYDVIEDITYNDTFVDEMILDIQEDDIQDIYVQDADVQDAHIYDSTEYDAEPTDTSTIDFGTLRGILFSAIENNRTKPSIFYIDPTGGVPQKISPDLTDEFTRPFWSYDGNSFYFESSGKVYKTPFGKFEPVEICYGMDFSVSPDEKLIALNKYVEINDMGDYDYELFIYNTETKKYTQITTFMDGEMENRPSSPSFSPDGKKILFSMLNPDGSYDVYSSDLFIYDISTGFLLNITNEAKKIQAKVANRSSEWSSDINKYAYLHILYPESGYYLVDGLSQPKRLSAQTHNGLDGVAFSPNANAIAIVSDMGKGIKVLDLNGNILNELPIIDLDHIDNLSWR